jgi:hypothetical protein
MATFTVLSMLLVSAWFYVQYVIGIESPLACVFCTLLYAAYLVRRVPLTTKMSGYKVLEGPRANIFSLLSQASVFEQGNANKKTALAKSPQDKESSDVDAMKIKTTSASV